MYKQGFLVVFGSEDLYFTMVMFRVMFLRYFSLFGNILPVIPIVKSQGLVLVHGDEHLNELESQEIVRLFIIKMW